MYLLPNKTVARFDSQLRLFDRTNVAFISNIEAFRGRHKLGNLIEMKLIDNFVLLEILYCAQKNDRY